jgi:hypothetical protein
MPAQLSCEEKLQIASLPRDTRNRKNDLDDRDKCNEDVQGFPATSTVKRNRCIEIKSRKMDPEYDTRGKSRKGNSRKI